MDELFKLLAAGGDVTTIGIGIWLWNHEKRLRAVEILLAVLNGRREKISTRLD